MPLLPEGRNRPISSRRGTRWANRLLVAAIFAYMDPPPVMELAFLWDALHKQHTRI
ncbi:MAG: hypothetical protein M3247_02925 [Thermoproteota archaeon]|nr:hypothetical protein [Thermoproteota archaeon]